MAFAFSTEKLEGVQIYILNGYVDKDAAKKIRESIAAQIKGGAKRYVLDFALAPLVNSSALAELIDLASQCISAPDLRFVFCGLSPTCRFSFNTVGIFHYVKDFPGRPEAIAAAAA